MILLLKNANLSSSNPKLTRVSTMSNDIKSGVGYIIPASAVIGFFASLFAGSYVLSIAVAVFGILGWFVYMLVVESKPPSLLGNLIILFGVLLSIGVFMAYGITQNMWGGMEFKTEGLLISLVVLFFSILTGMLFRGQFSPNASGSLSSNEKDLVRQAIESSDNSATEPRVIVVKQESSPEPVVEKEEEKIPAQPPYGYDPYAYAYPSDYYEDEDDDDEDDEYEWDDDEYEEEEDE